MRLQRTHSRRILGHCWYNEIIVMFSYNTVDNDENNTEDS